METKPIIRLVCSKLSPDLLKKEYRKENINNPMYGHCYVASEVIFHILEALRPNQYAPFRGKDENGTNHWWIVEISTGKILDATAQQYFSKGVSPPYEKGRKCCFLTKNPSKRAQILLKRIGLLAKLVDGQFQKVLRDR